MEIERKGWRFGVGLFLGAGDLMGIELNRACAHLKTTGFTCGAYALRDSDLCYWHHKARDSRERRRKTNQQQNAQTSGIVLPLLEDANSIQLTIQMVAQAVADRRITRAESGALLYSCQLAIMNLKNLEPADVVYSLRMLEAPTEGDEGGDVASAEEIPMEDDPEFRKESHDDDDDEDEEEEDDSEDGDEVDEEGLDEAEKFVMDNLERVKRLLPNNEIIQSTS
jgi:hypothetical protein